MQKITFYTAMLAILVLPVLMIGPLLSNKASKERCLRVIFPGRPSCRIHSCGPPVLTYREFVLTANEQHNAAELRQLKRELQHLRATDDRRNGVRIRVSNETPFQDYITGLDICKEVSRTFVPLSNDVYVPYGSEPVEYEIVPEDLEYRGFE